MRRVDLEHLLRAAGAILQESSFVVIGSQSILGQLPNAPPELLLSREADMFPKNAQEKSGILDGVLGEESAFDKTFGYYAQGVDETTATLPKGWKGRLVKIANSNTGGVTGYCLDPLDLVVSKLAAGREKDLVFVRSFLDHSLASPQDVEARVLLLDSTGPAIRQSEERIIAWLRSWRPPAPSSRTHGI